MSLNIPRNNLGREQSARRAVRQFCLECVGGSTMLVTNCTGVVCPLWRFRFGVKPETAERKRPDDMNPDAVLARHRKAVLQ